MNLNKYLSVQSQHSTYFTPFASVFFVDIEQVNNCREDIRKLRYPVLLSLCRLVQTFPY